MQSVDDHAAVIRVRLIFAIAAVGVIAILCALLITTLAFRDTAKPGEVVPAVLGAVTAAIGTIVGLVAGHLAGSAGKERAEQRADAREREAAAGRTLAESLKADETIAAADTEGASEAFLPESRSTDQLAIRRHAELAKRLFP
jgi:hypothetical protein